ncbi:ferredoxin--NADP reductase [Hymenobacter guriensis]|uniref:Ferredoxin--NADP reductase n=1 Tax=Hymenobacter guriensis TaxID=2793065 RepID=A0ABS0L773_9BACT|nr:ferredoxin--NADP reductase [Hymenobacter guriensis]MBG8555212.1 ferredoxin--NADP reductase [Hymenobacter guriensis]
MADLLSAIIPLRIEAIREEVPGVKSFVLAPVAPASLPYRAGQYLTLLFRRYGREVRRSYSISSAPALGEPLTITVKRIDNGLISRWLIDEARPGEQLQTIGAAGFFTLPEEPAAFRQLVLVAAGSGIAPMLGLLKTALHTHPTARVLLVYSNRTPSHTLFREELLALQARFPQRLHLELLYSVDANLGRARLHKPLLEDLVHRFSPGPVAGTLAYVCGPLDFMRMATYALHAAGLPLSDIRRELFTPIAVPATHVPPDMAAYPVSIRWRGQEYVVPVQYPSTILRAARQQGLALPYSCEAGQCGNCVARCTAGRVWMSLNEVLTDKETERGLVLTCTGYPIGGPVRLEF